MALPPSPVSDIKLQWYIDSTTGRLTVDVVRAPDGTLMTVHGADRVVQDVTRWLLTPLGSDPNNPSFGNPLFSQLGRPSSNTTEVIRDMVSQAQQYFIQYQSQAAAQGYLSTDEQVQQFTNLLVLQSGDIDSLGNTVPLGTLFISFDVVLLSGDSIPVRLPFLLSTAA